MPPRATWMRVGVGAGRARASPSTVNGMPSASAVSYSSSKTRGSSVEPRCEHRPRAEVVAPELLLVDRRLVGRERHVDHDRDVGLERERRRARARERDLLLRHRQRGRRRRRRRPPRRPAAPPRRRRSSRAGCPSSARRRARSGSSTGSPAITATSPMRTSDRASSPSFAPMSMCRSLELRRLLALLGVEQVDRLLADDAGHDAVARDHLERAGRRARRVPAADRR